MAEAERQLLSGAPGSKPIHLVPSQSRETRCRCTYRYAPDHSLGLSGLCLHAPISASPGAKRAHLPTDPASLSSERRAPVQFPHSCQPDAPILMGDNMARWPSPTLRSHTWNVRECLGKVSHLWITPREQIQQQLLLNPTPTMCKEIRPWTFSEQRLFNIQMVWQIKKTRKAGIILTKTYLFPCFKTKHLL